MDKRESHFVLVHGSCHGAWCWFKVTTLLRSGGHMVTVLDLAASGVHPKQVEEVRSMSDYLEPLMEFMVSLQVDDRVILVGHSMGGIGISVAMERFPDKISVAVFVAAFMPGPDLDFLTVFQEHPSSRYRVWNAGIVVLLVKVLMNCSKSIGSHNEILNAMDLILAKFLDEFYVDDGEDVDPRSKLKLIVPNSSCSGIIGKGGSTIKSFIEDSQAGIKISPQDSNYLGLNDRLVTLTGTVEKQMRAIDLILLKLAEDPHYAQSFSVAFPYAEQSGFSQDVGYNKGIHCLHISFVGDSRIKYYLLGLRTLVGLSYSMRGLYYFVSRC